MQVLNIVLSNNHDYLNSSDVFEGELFDLKNNAYKFTLHPRVEYWHFAIKLYSRDHDKEDSKEIVLSAGQWNKGYWTDPDRLSLEAANFFDQNIIPDADKNYQPLTALEFYIQYIENRNEVFVTYAKEKGQSVQAVFKVERDFQFFRIKAWSENREVHIDCELSIFSIDEINHNNDSFRLGNVEFRLGNMFDETVLSRTNLTLLPVSSNGSATSQILKMAEKFDLQLPPPPREAGQVSIEQVPSFSRLNYGGYAYSVSSHTINPRITQKLCDNIIAKTYDLTNISGINIPLFGTGTGGLDPVAVAEEYIERFNGRAFSIPVIVSVPSSETLINIKQRFNGEYYPLRTAQGQPKPAKITLLEQMLNVELSSGDFKTDSNGDVVYLNLNHRRLFNSHVLIEFKELRELNLNFSDLENLNFLEHLTQLEDLSLSNAHVGNFSIGILQNIIRLDLSFNDVKEFDFLRHFEQLEYLRLKGNRISNLYFLEEMRNLQYLDLSQNHIYEIGSLQNLRRLENLNLSTNQIERIDKLNKLSSLEILDISENNISDLKVINKLTRLRFLKADRNPFAKKLDLKLDGSGDHLPPIKNALSRQAERFKIETPMPVKILLLGNHASGKSSLLYFIQNDKLSDKMSSTHIIRIEKYPKNATEPPLAIFFDFGGQDYYHGIYRAFLSEGAIYAILWQVETNFNQQRKDSNGMWTRDFSLDYWLGQKTYLEKEKFHEDQEGPVILIQTHADRSIRQYPASLTGHQVTQDFFVSLKNEKNEKDSQGRATAVNNLGLKYLKEVLLDVAEQNRTKRKEPRWYVEFINFILRENETSDHLSKSVVDDILKYYSADNDEAEFESLTIELDQLHKHGLILYYKDDLPDRVWLNPVALVQYVHEKILNPDLLKTISPGILPYKQVDKFVPEIFTLLINQKVLFHHIQDNTIIIPNFLPLSSDADSDFELLTFGLGKPLFVLKFLNFLPFGLINQVICFFGQLPDIKKFWRDNLLFTLNGKCKVLINIDFKLLEIKVYTYFKIDVEPAEKNEITKFLFYGLLSLYWDQEPLNFEDYRGLIQQRVKLDDMDPFHPMHQKYAAAQNLFENPACRPLDLYLSVDGTSFIQYTSLCDAATTTMILAHMWDEDSKSMKEWKAISVYPFQHFTKKELKRPKKAVISYSKKDLEMVDKFRQYLIPLSDEGLLEKPWFCTELIAGNDWNEVIQQKFDEADIIFFMISENLMSTKYVKENEIKNAINKWNFDNQSVMIVPILLVPYPWTNTGKYNLGQFSALPYTTMAVNTFANQHEVWNSITEAIKIMITQSLYPGTESFELNSDMIQFYEKVVRMRQGIYQTDIQSDVKATEPNLTPEE